VNLLPSITTARVARDISNVGLLEEFRESIKVKRKKVLSDVTNSCIYFTNIVPPTAHFLWSLPRTSTSESRWTVPTSQSISRLQPSSSLFLSLSLAQQSCKDDRLTSSTRPNPPTPIVLTTLRSLSRMLSTLLSIEVIGVGPSGPLVDVFVLSPPLAGEPQDTWEYCASVGDKLQAIAP